LKPPCGNASSYSGDKFGVTDAASPLVDVLHWLAVVAARHAASAAFCCASDAAVFFSWSTTRHPLSSAVDNFRRRQSCCHLSSVQPSGFVLTSDAFCGFAKGAFGPFVTASLPGGLVADFLATFLGPVGAMAERG
jgi:hypothetical protein